MLFVAFKRFGQALGVFAEILVQRHQVHQLGIKAGLAFMLSSRALATSVLKALSCSANGDSSAESAVFCSAEKTRAEL